MKCICIITSSHGRDDIRLFQKHTVTLAEKGFFVYYIVTDGKERECGTNYIIDSLGITSRGKVDRVISLPQRLFKKVSKLPVDVFQICDPELISLGILLKKQKHKVLFDSIEDWEGYYQGVYKGPLGFIMSKALSISYKLYLNKFDRILVMSPNILERLAKYAPDKVIQISNYPISRYSEREPISKADYTNKLNRFIYCGSTYSFSVQETVAAAMKDISSLSPLYTLVGKISENRKKSIVAIDPDHVEFIPWVNKTELVKLYRESIAGIVIFEYTPICCNREGQMGSNKIFEYMLEGLPVICTDFSLWKSLIIDKYKCGICVNPYSETDIREAIKYIITHKEEAYMMGQRGRNAIFKEFNWEITSRFYVKLIEDLM